jgi:arginase
LFYGIFLEQYTRVVLDIIGAPFDLCGHTLGSRLGPAAIRSADLLLRLRDFGDIADSGDCPVSLDPDPSSSIRSLTPFLGTLAELKQKVGASLLTGNLPIVLGGDHSLSMATISAALKHFGSKDLAVLWIDAHADLNTPRTSPSGNLHGMSVAALCGMSSGLLDHDWETRLLPILGTERLRLGQVAWLGLRDVDRGERAILNAQEDSLTMTMHDIDRHGIVHELQRFHTWMRHNHATNLWISFDVDVLDPVLAPGTGTAVRGGLTYREAHLVAELLHELKNEPNIPYRIAGVDLMETNPLCDTGNATAKVAVEWLASLFGQTILGIPE